MKVIDVPQRGKRGNVVASWNRFGQYICERGPRKQPGTEAQMEAWRSMAMLSRVWNELEEERREAWRRRAGQVHSRPNLGQYGSLDGRLLFLKINRTLATCWREPALDPPPPPRFRPNPVRGFEIRLDDGLLVFALKLAPGAKRETPEGEDIMVFSWAPYNPGAATNTSYAFLGLLPPPEPGESDISDLYLRKLRLWRMLKHRRYHVPLAGARIFVRVWQQVNGWENELGMFRASAFVPRRLPRKALWAG
ncbi:MAG TPA: hypothetical protein VMU04_13820 [Candidatus Acidoferrum sp.]|nr:hypothetical protein [Candidatus Acidoferrum sp.]